MTSDQHPPEISRRNTHHSHHSSTFSRWIRRDHRAFTITSGMSGQPRNSTSSGSTYDEYPSYDITWDYLKRLLQEKWPRRAFSNVGERKKDRWIFRVPKKLTEKDREDIAALRDVNQTPPQRRQSFSDSED
ncbi:hypothetical protein RB213_000089 [Colletotrichum asianum]